MSVIPEIILHRVIVRGFQAIRKDSRILDALFRNVDQPTLDAIKHVVTKEKIHLTFNYPRKDAINTPGISITLKSEQEAQTFLGDVMGASPHYTMPDQELTIDTLSGHGASTSTLGGLPEKLLGPLQILTAEYNEQTGNTRVVLDPTHDAEISEYLSAPSGCMEMYTISGQGAGQVGLILKITTLGLDIEGRFDPQLDSSTIVDIRRAGHYTLPIGEPSRVYSEGATNLIRKGANYDVQYQLSIFAESQDEVLYLYSVVKAILFSQKNFMEGQGLMALKISGADFAPVGELLPSEIFQRVLNISFTYPFHFLEELETFDRFSLNLDVSPVDADCIPISFDIVIE